MLKRIKRFFTRNYRAETPLPVISTSESAPLPAGSHNNPSSSDPTKSPKLNIDFLGDVVYLMLFVLFIGVVLMTAATIALWYQAITAKTASYEELNIQVSEQNAKIDALTNALQSKGTIPR